MSGFEADWLTLREPADRRARDRELLTKAAAFAASRTGSIVDLGCGTGSTFHALDARIPGSRDWIFVDDDMALLDRAASRLDGSARARVSFETADLSHLTDHHFRGAALVTASAFFDLVSDIYLAGLAAMLASCGTGLYAALSVDGRIEWAEPHRCDEIVTAAFAGDQRRDKGFGPGLGGDAADAMEAIFKAAGFEVLSGPSDWVLGPEDIELQDAFHEGYAAPARSVLAEGDVDDWLAHRRRSARAGGGLRVGHRDIVALPPAS